jgi:hypothetical protein
MTSGNRRDYRRLGSAHWSRTPAGLGRQRSGSPEPLSLGPGPAGQGRCHSGARGARDFGPRQGIGMAGWGWGRVGRGEVGVLAGRASWEEGVGLCEGAVRSFSTRFARLGETIILFGVTPILVGETIILFVVTIFLFGAELHSLRPSPRLLPAAGRC